MSSIGRVCVFGTTSPSAPNWNASFKSWRVPTSEPTTRMPSNTRRGMDKSIDSVGRPTATTVPPARTALTASLNADFATAVTTAACAPSRCSCIYSLTFSFLGFSVISAPDYFANSN